MPVVVSTNRRGPSEVADIESECSYAVDGSGLSAGDDGEEAAINCAKAEAGLFPTSTEFRRVIWRPYGVTLDNADAWDGVRGAKVSPDLVSGIREVTTPEAWKVALRIGLYLPTGRPGHLFYPGCIQSTDIAVGRSGRLILTELRSFRSVLADNFLEVPWTPSGGNIYTSRGMDAFEQGGALYPAAPWVDGVSILNRLNRINRVIDGESAERLDSTRYLVDLLWFDDHELRKWIHDGTEFNPPELQGSTLDALGAARSIAEGLKDWDDNYPDRVAGGLVRESPRHPFPKESISGLCGAIKTEAETQIAALSEIEPYEFVAGEFFLHLADVQALHDGIQKSRHYAAALALAPILERPMRPIY